MQGSSGAVLIAHGDEPRARALVELLGSSGIEAAYVASADEAWSALKRRAYDVIVASLELRGSSDGMDLVRTAGSEWPDVSVILLGAEGSEGRAAETLRAGAADYLEAPVSDEQVVYAVQKELKALAGAAERPPQPAAFDGPVIGESRAIKKVHDLIRRVAPGTATVLIRGESGTGKELAARALHEKSPRYDRPFVKVHCAALPDTLLESELFGYEKGAFTGAASRKLGRVEIAQEGTLFLDEIGDITLAMQVKLLRLLQDREFERLGGTQTLKADIRFIAATHRDLDRMVKKSEFREDLFYRLNVVTLWLPSLRARRDDIELLARHFCKRFAAANARPAVTLGDDAIAALRAQRWPGNVRELQNFIEKLVVLSEGDSITASDVKRELSEQGPFATEITGRARTASCRTEPSSSGARATSGGPAIAPLSEEMREAERRALMRALAHTKGNRSLAARILGVSRTTLYNKLVEHGLS